MYIQRCIKGIAGRFHGGDGITEDHAVSIIRDGTGIISNWWRKLGRIDNVSIADALTDHNLDRHIHDYENFCDETPFISLACGSVERNVLIQDNFPYSAVDTALMFATQSWKRPGALFYCWVPTSHSKTVAISTFAEPVRDLNIYQRWSPFQLEGEITAKIHIPSNQIEKVEWWDEAHSTEEPQHVWHNSKYIDPAPLSNIRDFF